MTVVKVHNSYYYGKARERKTQKSAEIGNDAKEINIDYISRNVKIARTVVNVNCKFCINAHKS